MRKSNNDLIIAYMSVSFFLLMTALRYGLDWVTAKLEQMSETTRKLVMSGCKMFYNNTGNKFTNLQSFDRTL